MNQPPAFQFYVDNFIEGTSEMSPHECGCYVRLLCHQWSRGQIPLSDPQKLRRVAGGVVSNEVLAKFPDGKNNRLEREREKQQAWREKSREGGLKGAATRAGRVAQPPLQPNGQPNGNIPSPSPSPSPNREGKDATSIPQAMLGASELPTREQALAMTMCVGIPPKFSKYVYDDWASRNGKDGSGVVVGFLPYALKRWVREQNEWKARTHKGNKAPVGPNGEPYLDPHRAIGNGSP